MLGNLVIGNSGEVPEVAGHGARGKCGWFGAGEIGPVRNQYQLRSFAEVRAGSAQLSQTDIADGTNCKFTPTYVLPGRILKRCSHSGPGCRCCTDSTGYLSSLLDWYSSAR